MKNTFIVHILIYNVLCTIFSCSNHKYCFWDRGVLCLIIIFKKLQYVQRMDLKIQWTYITFWDSWFYKEIVEISLYTLIWCANLFIFSCCWLENIFKGVQCTYIATMCVSQTIQKSIKPAWAHSQWLLLLKLVIIFLDYLKPFISRNLTGTMLQDKICHILSRVQP